MRWTCAYPVCPKKYNVPCCWMSKKEVKPTRGCPVSLQSIRENAVPEAEFDEKLEVGVRRMGEGKEVTVTIPVFQIRQAAKKLKVVREDYRIGIILDDLMWGPGDGSKRSKK